MMKKQKKIAAKKAEEEAAAAAAAAANATNGTPSANKDVTAVPQAAAAKQPAKNPDEQPKESSAAEGKNTPKTEDAPSLTPEQDKLLLQLKAEGKTWKEIAAAIGRSASTVKARFKEIKPDDDAKPVDEKAEEKTEKKAEAKDEKQAGKSQPKEKKKEEPKPAEKSEEKKQVDVQASYASQPGYIQLVEDELFNFDELSILSEIMTEDLAAFYSRIRDRFYDLTNRRLKVEFIQAKCRAEQYPEGNPYC